MFINYKIVFNIIGIVIFFLGLLMCFPGIYAFIVNSYDATGIFIASGSSVIFGAMLFYFTKSENKSIGKREGYLIVSLAWIFTSLVCAAPYIFAGACSQYVNAFFESISGLTTTGATIFTDIEALPQGILLWRSMTQWIGGMGIIVLTVAIFPLLGIGGVELFVAESPGPTSNKIHPRIKETAKRLWLLYVCITLILIVVLFLEGMTAYDALNHGLTTIATGGFSTKNASIAHFSSPLIQYTIIFFMFLAGTNYSLIYAGVTGKFSKVWASDEFKAYVFFVCITVFMITLSIYNTTDRGLESSFRAAAFQIISIITTTGFVSADYTSWHPSTTMFFFFLLFAGGCAGSTAGGIKFIRHLVFAKNSFLEFKRLLHPNSLIRIRIDGNLVAPKILTHVLVFLLIYLIIFFLGTFVMSFILVDFEQPLLSAAGSVATSLGNVGPAIGQLGPVDNFAQVPAAGKCVLAFIMLLGRLELFSILILFTPYFWRIN